MKTEEITNQSINQNQVPVKKETKKALKPKKTEANKKEKVVKKIKKQEKNIQSLLVQKERLVKKIVFYRRKNTKQKLQVAKDVRLLMKSLNNYKS